MKGGKKALHVVSAFVVENKLVLGQTAIDKKSNEITAIPELLKMLAIKGCIVTIDAMGTRKEIAAEIINQEADYMLSLKEYQKTLHGDIELYMRTEVFPQEKEELERQGAYHRTIDKEHGGLEKREYFICNDVSWLLQKDEWKNLQGFGVCISTATTEERVSVEIEGKKEYTLEEKLL